ncbi:hypothetical protein LCGC14_1778720 [marine sediment metagenome]|uniref:Uncharacterized protein n=1 Tax=marine sediment metagenome TaxID=412755 RepID=A0A0F9GVZ0_9ZZZZ
MDKIQIPPKGARITIGNGEWKVIAYRFNSRKMTMKLVEMAKRPPQSTLDKKVLEVFDKQIKEKEETKNE